MSVNVTHRAGDTKLVVQNETFKLLVCSIEANNSVLRIVFWFSQDFSMTFVQLGFKFVQID